LTNSKTATSNGIKLSSLLGIPTYTGANNLAIAKGSEIQTVTGGKGKDVIISGRDIGGTAHLNGAAGDDSYFVASGDAVINDSNGLNDTVLVAKIKGANWTVDADHTRLTNIDVKIGATLATVDISGIENVSFWNGKKLKASGKPLYSPLVQNPEADYASKANKTTINSVNIKF
jgi:hypothetical protein